MWQLEFRAPGAAVIFTDVAKAFEKVLLMVAWCQTMNFVFSQRVLGVLCGVFEFQRTE